MFFFSLNIIYRHISQQILFARSLLPTIVHTQMFAFNTWILYVFFLLILHFLHYIAHIAYMLCTYEFTYIHMYICTYIIYTYVLISFILATRISRIFHFFSRIFFKSVPYSSTSFYIRLLRTCLRICCCVNFICDLCFVTN